MSEYDPPVPLLQEIVRFASQLVKTSETTCAVVRVQEQAIMRAFVPLTAQLRAVRGFDHWAGWPTQVSRTITNLIALVDRLKRAWGWDAYDQPEPHRSHEILAAEAEFDRRFYRPVLRAALAWTEGDHAAYGLPTPPAYVRELAIEAQKRDVEPLDDVWRAVNTFQDRYLLWLESPVWGDASPVIGATLQNELKDILRILESHLDTAEDSAPPPPNHGNGTGNGNGNGSGPKRRTVRYPQPIGD